jgi:hypothetical protein
VTLGGQDVRQEARKTQGHAGQRRPFAHFQPHVALCALFQRCSPAPSASGVLGQAAIFKNNTEVGSRFKKGVGGGGGGGRGGGAGGAPPPPLPPFLLLLSNPPSVPAAHLLTPPPHTRACTLICRPVCHGAGMRSRRSHSLALLASHVTILHSNLPPPLPPFHLYLICCACSGII